MRIRMLSLPSAALLVTACGGSSAPTGPSGPPVVTLVNGATQPSGTLGSTTVIQGSNFGTSAAAVSGHVLFSNGTGGRDTAVIATVDWTNVLIVTTVPAGLPIGKDTLWVQTSGGTSAPILFTVVAKVQFSPSTVSWTKTDSLPVGLSGHALAAGTLPGTPATSVVYVVGGADSTNTPRDSVLYATVSATGSLGAWVKTMTLPGPVAFAAAVVATPANSPVTGTSYLYVIGGDSTAGGKPVATVYRGTLSATGAVTAWSATTSLPTPVHSPGAVIFNGSVYVAGGSGSGNAPVANVYRIGIQSDGTLGAQWQTLASLPFARSYFGFGIDGTFLYALGGDSGTVAPNDSTLAGGINDVIYAAIDVHTGSLTASGWTANGNKLKKAVNKHTAVVAGASILVTAGLYTGSTTGSTEESYATLNTDGSTSAFNGATGANTISSAGGGNLFNQAAVGYLDSAGAFHVLVVGGDDVNTPTKKHKGVYYY
ncbi:MAG TPA: hypothetical protein VFD76_04085 [Gemmatimonadales bacterium]|nr:hypothetical protein [Gemmatimonadales bacterium]